MIPYNEFIEWARGYCKDVSILKVALQVTLAYIIFGAITFPNKTWNALSYGAITPGFGLVFIIFMAPRNQGGVTLSGVYVVTGVLLGGALATGATYAA